MKLVSERRWQAAGEAGDAAVRQALGARALAMLKQDKGCQLAIALGFGALTAAGEFLASVGNTDGRQVLEQWALAYVRGAIRGAGGPVHDDGRPMQGTYDAQGRGAIPMNQLDRALLREVAASFLHLAPAPAKLHGGGPSTHQAEPAPGSVIFLGPLHPSALIGPTGTIIAVTNW